MLATGPLRGDTICRQSNVDPATAHDRAWQRERPYRDTTVCWLRGTFMPPRRRFAPWTLMPLAGGIFPILRGNWWDEEPAAEPSGF